MGNSMSCSQEYLMGNKEEIFPDEDDLGLEQVPRGTAASLLSESFQN